MISDKKSNFLMFFSLFALVLLWIIFTQSDVINRDGAGYLMQVNLIKANHLQLAKTLYPDLGFAYLIYYTHFFLKISIENTALLLNYIFTLISTIFYVLILNQIKSDYRLLISGLIVLACSVPILDDYFVMIIRDHGMWLGSLGGVYFTQKWFNTKNIVWLPLAIIFFIVGGLFRPESFVLILAIPLIFLNFNLKKKISSFIPIILLFIIFILIIFFTKDYLNVSRINDVFLRPYDALNNLFLPLALSSNDLWLSQLINDFSISIKFLILSNIFIQKWFFGLGIINFFIFIYAIKKIKGNEKISANYKILNIFLFLSGLIVFINLISTNVISTRYFVFHFWIIYIFVSFGLYNILFLSKNNLIFNKINISNSSVKSITILLLFILFLDVIFDKKKINHEELVSNYFSNNNIPLNSIYVDDLRLRLKLRYDGINNTNYFEAINNDNYHFFIFPKNININNLVMKKLVEINYTEEKLKPKYKIFIKKDK
jgi:hypothetical protein